MRHQSLRLSTKVGETRFEFHHTDATGFPRPLPPVRKIGLGRRALAGLQPSAKLSQGGVARFESSLERDFLALLEFSNDVIRWDPQPVEIPVGVGRTYVPDVLVKYVGPERDLRRTHCVLYEVKYRDELRRRWPELRPRYKAAVRYARERGWRFRLATEVEIRTPLLWNAKFLLPYLDDTPIEDDCVLLRRTLIPLIETTPADLLSACSSDRWVQARLLSGLWHMVARRSIGTDLTQRLTMATPIWHA